MPTTVISPELVLVDPELRATVIAEYRAAASQVLPVFEWTNPYEPTDSDPVVFRTSSENAEKISIDQGQTPLVVAAAIYAAARVLHMLFMTAAAGVGLALVIAVLEWLE
jgi:hypothetical protein